MTFKYISLRELESSENRFKMITLDHPEVSGTYFFETDPDTIDVKAGRSIPRVAYKQINVVWSEEKGERFLTVEIKNKKVLEAIANFVEVDPSSIDNVSQLGFPRGE